MKRNIGLQVLAGIIVTIFGFVGGWSLSWHKPDIKRAYSCGVQDQAGIDVGSERRIDLCVKFRRIATDDPDAGLKVKALRSHGFTNECSNHPRKMYVVDGSIWCAQ